MKRLMILPILALPVLVNAQGQPSLVSVVFKPSTVSGGTSASATITISAPARQNGFEIALSLNSTSAQLKSSTITIPEGQSSQAVTVTTSAVPTSQIVILAASTRAETRSGALTVTPPSISGITVAPSSVTSGQQATATITLTSNAPSGGFPVELSSSSSTAVPVPGSVSVPAGQRTANVPITSRSVSDRTPVTLTAEASGSAKTTTLTVVPVPVSIVSLQYPAEPMSGTTATRSITISGPAPTGGAIIQIGTTGADILRANGAAVADTVPAGQRTISKSKPVPLTDADRAFEMTATINGTSARRSGTLKAPTIVSLSFPDSVFEGTTTYLGANLNGMPPNTGIPVVITSDNQSAITSPGTVFLTYTGGILGYVIRANAVDSRTPVTLSIERGGAVQRISTTVVQRVPLLTGFTALPTPVRAGQEVTLTATIDSPAPPGGSEVRLYVLTSLVGFPVPSTLLIPANATSGSIKVATPKLAVPVYVEVTARFNRRERAATVRISP